MAHSFLARLPPSLCIRFPHVLASGLALALAAACSSSDETAPAPAPVTTADAGTDSAGTITPTPDDDEATLPAVDMTGPIGGARPGQVITPPDFDASNPSAKSYPLVVLLHGYGFSDAVEDVYLQLSDNASKAGFVTLLIDGSVDPAGKNFWNDTSACCDLYGAGVDDLAYIRDTVRQVQARYAIDKKRTFLFGHSNGAFMAHKLACVQSNRFAGIAALAGAMTDDATKCAPGHPVAVLTIHGTADDTIGYTGGAVKHLVPKESVPYPSALSTIATWGARNGCAATPTTDAPRDYETTLAGSETTPTRYAECKPGGAAELWTIDGGGHTPAFSADFMPAVFAFWAAHPRP